MFQRVVNNLAAFNRARWRIDFDVAKTAQHGDVVNAVVGAGERAIAGSGIEAKQFYVAVVVANVDFDLLVGARNQKRCRVAGYGNFAAHRQADRRAHQRLLCNADIHQSVRKLLHKG
ncbi:hypothetical protein D3C75_744980 [compost metagenome]